MEVLLYVLGLIVLILSCYLGYLLSQLKQKKSENKRIKEEYEESFNKRKDELYDSLYTLALVMIQDQVSVAEGCIRIKKLIDLDDDLRFHADLANFHKAYIDFSQFDYLDNYKKLSNQEKWTQDLRRQEIEQKHTESLVISSKALKEITGKYLENRK